MLKTGKSKVNANANANASGQSDDTTITDPGPGPEEMVMVMEMDMDAKTMKTMKTSSSPSSSPSPLPEESSEQPNKNADVNTLGLSTPTQSSFQTQRDDRHSVDSSGHTDRSTTTKAKPAHTHETTPQAPDEAHCTFTNPASVIRSFSPAPAPRALFVPSSTSNVLPINPPHVPKSNLPILSNSDFITSFPQSGANTMIFSHGPGSAHRHRSMATTSALTEYEADLTSKDRLKQKEAIKNILAAKVRTDWSFPDKVDETALQPSEALPEEDPSEPMEWVERAEWLSEFSNSEAEDDTHTKTNTTVSTTANEKPTKGKLSKNHTHPFRFDSPDGGVGEMRKSVERRKLRRQRKLEAELAYNEGLRCFVARRNKWTGARIVRRPKGTTLSSVSPNGFNSEKSIENADECQEEDEAILDTLLPIAPPLLPPDTPMRRNITSRAYSTIYDKVILQSQTPFCPINLQTIVSSCVEGWKRDGEWPPKGTEPEVSLARRRNEPGKGEKGVWRRSLQRVFGRAGSSEA